MSFMSYDMGSLSQDKTKELLKRYEPMVHHIVAKFRIPRGHFAGVDNEDLLQVGRIGILQGYLTYKEGGKALDTWVYQIARQHVSEEVRKAVGCTREDWTGGDWSRNTGAMLLSADHPEFKEPQSPRYEQPIQFDRMVAMEQAERVPKRYREVTELYAKGYTLDDIAEVKGVTRQAVYWWLQAARRKWNQ